MRLGYQLFSIMEENGAVNPISRIVVLADDIELKDQGSTRNYLDPTITSANATGHPFYGIPRDTEIYVHRDSNTHKNIQTSIDILNSKASRYSGAGRWTPNFVFLEQPVAVTAQDGGALIPLNGGKAVEAAYDSAASQGYPTMKDPFSDGGMSDTIPDGLLRPYQISAFDALVAAHIGLDGWVEGQVNENLLKVSGGVIDRGFDRDTHTEYINNADLADAVIETAFGRDASRLVVYVNGERYENAEMAKVRVGEGDSVHFMFETGEGSYTPRYFDGAKEITALDLAPRAEKQLRLRYFTEDMGYRIPHDVANTDVYAVDLATGGQTKLGTTNGSGNITLSFDKNGEYSVTAFSDDGSIAAGYLAVNVYAPDPRLGELNITAPVFDPDTYLQVGYQSGALVKIADGGEAAGEGFDRNHNKYKLYVLDDTSAVTIEASQYEEGTVTLTTTGAASDLSGASPEGGKWTIPVTLTEDETALTVTTSLTEGGEQYTRTYEITIVKSEIRIYAGILAAEGIPGAGVGQTTTLNGEYERGDASIALFTHPGQTEAAVKITVNSGTAVTVNGAAQSGYASEGGKDVYTLAIACADAQSAQITTSRTDGDGEYAYTVNFNRRTAVHGVYTPDRVKEYNPATGQYSGTGGFANPASVLYGYTHYMKALTLGQHGGYVTYEYDVPITNDPKNPYGIDFIVYGNAFEGGKANEPGGVEVSYDGATWYYLAGQRHYEPGVSTKTEVPLLGGDKTNSLLIQGGGLPGFTGGYPDNVQWGYADVATASINENAETSWYVDAKPYNPYREGSLASYADGGNVGDGFDLSWAVSKTTGKPVDLATALPNGIKYIKIQNVTDIKTNGSLGEVSPEIGTVTRVNPANVKTADVGVTNAPTLLTVNGSPLPAPNESLNGGQTAYCEINLDGSPSVNVEVKGAATDNIFVNMERYTGTADYTGLVADDGTRTVRVLIQNGEREPLIYVIKCTNGGDPKTSAGMYSMTLTPGDVSLAPDSNGNYTAQVESNVARAGIAVRTQNPGAKITLDGTDIAYNVPVVVDLQEGENVFKFTVTPEDGTTAGVDYTVTITRKTASQTPPPANTTITIKFAFTGDDIHYEFPASGDKYEMGKYTGPHNPQLWIPSSGTDKTVSVTLPVGSTAKYLTDMMLYNAGIDFITTSGGTYISGVQIPGTSTYLNEFDNGPNSGWMYRIDGKIANRGYADRVLQNGNEVLWFYTDDYTKEENWEDESGWNLPPTGSGPGTGGGDNTTTVDDPETPLSASGGGAIVATETVTAETKTENGKATATVETTAITDAIAKAQEAVNASTEANAQAEIKIAAKTPDTTEPISSSEVNIPAAAVKAIAAAQDLILTVESDISTVTLDTTTLATISETADDNDTVKITAEAMDSAVVNLTITVGNTPIADLGGTATVSLPYTPEADLAAADYDLLTVYYLADDGSMTEVRGAHYDAATGKITFATNHFSKFFISEWINPFTDIAKGEWFYKSARYAYSNALITGTTDTTFAPQSTLTRAMLITILARDAGIDTSGGDTWYSKAVDWGMSNGLTDGTNMNNPITREQFATLLFRYAKLQGKNTSEASDYSAYTDAESVSDWAREAMAWAYATGLVTGRTATTLAPLGTANRAEAATLLQRYLENIT